ncbi:MAG TPA: gamma-glutamyl-gamma-aminobutyrate hydrolase family protein [Gemmatimonadaceae bacterium]|nr:gamma-glutamyl-gamma-aminobutyrate hydrolase family protein [Gemmatimonadaceae bacterium]
MHVAHRAIPAALELVGNCEHEWLATDKLRAVDLNQFDGLWAVPATPYRDGKAVIAAIRFARESRVPFLGTCGGFQHMILEYAANVWGVDRPAHAEEDPGADDPVITPLACALVETTGNVRFAPGSRLATAYGALGSVEGYHCSYGISPRHINRFASGELRVTAWDDAGSVRAVELGGHPFFVGTLFQPERAALEGRVPQIVRAFVRAAREREIR